MEQQRRETNTLEVADHEAEASLLRRLDALERLVFGRTAPGEVEVQPLVPKVEAIAKAVTRAEGGRRELEELATQASHLGLLSSMPSTSAPAIDNNVALKESIVLAARGEIEATASVLAKVKALDKHINPPYLRVEDRDGGPQPDSTGDRPPGPPERLISYIATQRQAGPTGQGLHPASRGGSSRVLSARLGQLDRTYTAQATEAARINERAENACLHYSQAVSLVSEKFVHWDDQVAELERQHASRP